MLPLAIESQLIALKRAEAAECWAARPRGEIAELLFEVASLFCEHGDAFSDEIADEMGVTPSEVWLEVVFPSVWGLLSTACLFSKASSSREQRAEISSVVGSSERVAWSDSADIANESPSGHQALRLLPQNKLEALLLPKFRGYALFKCETRLDQRQSLPAVSSQNTPSIRSPALALCLLPFNLASIGVLDIVHLLCARGLRVVAKISEKAEFVGPYLEKIFAPFVQSKALLFLRGGPELGAELAARPEFSHVHLTGSAGTAAKVEQVVGPGRFTCELGGVTPAIVLPDALSTKVGIRHTARQLAFGALANNGQHCVSYQIALVPDSHRRDFERTLWLEMQNVAARGGSDGFRTLIDATAAQRLESLLIDAQVDGAQLTPADPRARGKAFPVSLVSGVKPRMRLFREEAFGPVVGVMGLQDSDFEQHALRMANSRELSGDLAASLFTSKHESDQTRRMIGKLKHGIVTVNTYPGVAFATSLPWGAGPAGLSGRGWVHNYQCLPEAKLRKVVLTAPLGRKGFGPLCWEDPWLLNVYGAPSLNFARALVQITNAYFNRQALRFAVAQVRLMSALTKREITARQQDRRRID
jgi:acyl-CoA reductase-like NAD-dependent aldehyde dehydrogenase